MADADGLNDFLPCQSGMKQALDRLLTLTVEHGSDTSLAPFDILPNTGLGQPAAADLAATMTLDRAPRFQSPGWFAHMDPPTPWVTQAFAAAMNQNLLHPDTGDIGRQVEAQVVQALAPHFGMDGGHMVPGSTLANLTALWRRARLPGSKRWWPPSLPISAWPRQRTSWAFHTGPCRAMGQGTS